MDSLAYNIGYTVLGFFFLFIFVFFLSKSPLLMWLSKLIFLLGWVFTSPIATLVIVIMNLNDGNYWMALIMLLAGSLSSAMGFMLYADLKKILKKENRNFKLWKN